MKNKIFFFVIFLVFIIFPQNTVNATTEKQAIVLMGQSNAERMYPYLLDYLKAGNIPIKVILCTKGGMSISYFVKGTDMYTACLGKIKQAIGEGYSINAIFFNQGEADTGINRYLLWRSKFVNLMWDLRADCGCQPLIIYARLNVYPTNPEYPITIAKLYWNSLRQIQYQLSIDRPNFHMLNMDGLPMTCPLHYCGQYTKMSKMFMDEYHRLQK